MRMTVPVFLLFLVVAPAIQSQDARDARQDGQIASAMELSRANAASLSRLSEAVGMLGREISMMNGWVKGFGSGLGILMLIQTALQVAAYRRTK